MLHTNAHFMHKKKSVSQEKVYILKGDVYRIMAFASFSDFF